MKSWISLAVLSCFLRIVVFAQPHYQMMPLAVDHFLQNRENKFEEIEVVWNMEGILQADLNDGINYVLENKPARAERSLTIVLEKDPNLWQAWYYRAVARKQMKRYEDALADLKQVLKLKPALYEAHVESARIFLPLNRLADGEASVKRAILLDTKRPSAYYIKGCLQEVQNKPQSAISSFRECLRADSTYHDARIDIALVMLMANKSEKDAVKELDAVVRQDSLHQHALMMRSILMFDKKKDQSLNDLSRVIRVNPNNIVAFYLRGMLFTYLQQFDRGFADFQNVIKSTVTDDNNFKGQQTWIDKKIDIQNVGAYTLTRVYGMRDEDATKVKQAFCLILTDAYDKSLAVLHSTSDPDGDPLTVYLQAVVNEHQGNHKAALKYYDEALRLDNAIADAYKKRGIYAQELKLWDVSIADFTRVLELMPESFVMYKIRGISYYHNKNYDAAIVDFTRYLERDSTNEQIIGYRGMAYLEKKEHLRAYMDFSNSRNMHMLNYNHMMYLVNSVMQTGDTTLVLEALACFVRNNPTFLEAYTLKLRLHVLQNDWASVQQDLMHAQPRKDAPKQILANFLTVKGMWLSKTQSAEALGVFNQAVKSDRNNAFAHLERGKYLLAQNKTAKAIDDLKKASSLGSAEAKHILTRLPPE